MIKSNLWNEFIFFLHFQKHKSPSWQSGGMVIGGRHAASIAGWELMPSMASRRQREQTRKSRSLKCSAPTASNVFLQQGCTSYTSPNSATNKVFKQPSLWGTYLIQTHTGSDREVQLRSEHSTVTSCKSLHYCYVSALLLTFACCTKELLWTKFRHHVRR